MFQRAIYYIIVTPLAITIPAVLVNKTFTYYYDKKNVKEIKN